MSTPSARSFLLLVHIWWPLATGLSLALVVARATGRPWQPAGVAALLCGIVAAYSLDRVIDAPPALTPRLRAALAVVAMSAALATIALVPVLPFGTALLMPLLGAVALAYPVLKRSAFGKTVLVPLVWTWSAIALPFNDGSWFGWHWLREPVAGPVFLLMTAGCLLCDLKDEDRDRVRGVTSLPAAIGSAATVAVAAGLALAAASLALAEGRMGMTFSGLALGGVTLWPALLATDVVGPLVVDVILTLPGLLIAARVV